MAKLSSVWTTTEFQSSPHIHIETDALQILWWSCNGKQQTWPTNRTSDWGQALRRPGNSESHFKSEILKPYAYAQNCSHQMYRFVVCKCKMSNQTVIAIQFNGFFQMSSLKLLLPTCSRLHTLVSSFLLFGFLLSLKPVK